MPLFVRVQEVTAATELEEVYRFRYRVYVDELRKPLPSADHERRVVTDALDRTSRVLAAVDEESGSIVGTVRTQFGCDHPFDDDLIARLSLGPMIDAVGMERLTHSSAFMVDPAYRGLTIASQLVMGMVHDGLARGAVADVCISELALVRPYYQLGYRPYAPPFRPFETAGLRVPLVWIVQDRGYLLSVGSPFAHAVPADLDDGGVTASLLGGSYPEFRSPTVAPRQLREFWAAFAHSAPAYRAPSVFDGVDSARVEALLGKLPTLRLTAGERLYQRGERERGMSLLLSGKLGVTVDAEGEPFFLTVLVPGEICGEMAGFLQGRRSASLVALEDCELLLLPHDLVDKLQRREPELAAAVRANLNAVLSWRLDAMNHRLAGLGRGNPERIAVAPQPTAAGLSRNLPRTGSYTLETLENSAEELERLEKQAAVAHQLEAVWFRKLGFADGMHIVDLGAGPGVTTCLLARTFAGARVTGVEPDEALRARATARAERFGMADRCTFVAGTGGEIPAADGAVDAVYARFLFQHLPDPAATLDEVHRVLRPGGIAAMVDVDDGGVVVHPEPPALAGFQTRVSEAQQALGGDRHVGRKLVALLSATGFGAVRNEVVPLSSHAIPIADLVGIAFGFKGQLLRCAGSWQDEDADLMRQLQRLGEEPGAWLYIPVFLGHGRKNP
jgi:CRP-like cAMP-binding protein